MTCPDCERVHKEAAEAWAVVAEFQRRMLIIANAVRGTERVLNRQPHMGKAVNVVIADGSVGMERGR